MCDLSDALRLNENNMATLNNEYFANYIWNTGIVKLQRVTVNYGLRFLMKNMSLTLEEIY